jgi:hypothetical protein
MNRIRIETKAGRMIVRKAAVTEYIDRDGRQWSVAQVGIHLYKVNRRDTEGSVYKVW